MTDANNILNQLNQPGGAPVAGVPVTPATPGFVPASPAGVPMPGYAPTPPALAPVPVPGYTPGAPLNGGGRLATMKDQMRTASAGGGRNDIALGKAWYVLKDGKFEIKERSKCHLTNYSFICIKAIEDINGLAPGIEGYSGAIVGQEYSTALFQVGDYVMNSNLSALRACMGWTPEQVKVRQANPEGNFAQTEELCNYVIALTGYDPERGATGQPCCFSNQLILEMSAKIKKANAKKINGVVPCMPGTNTPMTTEHRNVFWNRRIRLGEAQQAGVPNEVLLKAFGDDPTGQTFPAWERACATEQVLDQQV